MKPADEYYLFAFHSTHAAMAAQKLFSDLGCILMPTLRCITASCGMSLRVSPQAVPEALRRMRAMAVDPELYLLFRVKTVQGQLQCERIAL